MQKEHNFPSAKNISGDFFYVQLEFNFSIAVIKLGADHLTFEGGLGGGVISG